MIQNYSNFHQNLWLLMISIVEPSSLIKSIWCSSITIDFVLSLVQIKTITGIDANQNMVEYDN